MNCNQPGATGPVVVVYPDGTWYDGLQPEDAEEFVDMQLVSGQPLTRRLMHAPIEIGNSAC